MRFNTGDIDLIAHLQEQTSTQISMGIKGLTSLVTKLGLGKAVKYKIDLTNDEPASQLISSPDGSAATDQSTPITRRPLIVDGGALIYHVFFQSGDWIHGGNFAKFAAYLRAYCWVLSTKLGFDLMIVVDGAVNEQKMATILRREDDKMRRLLKAQRSVQANDQSYRHMDGFMPPLAYQVAIDVLKSIPGVWLRVVVRAGVDSPDNQHQSSYEADSLVAGLAVKHEALVLSKDSDFYIFDTVGYMPLHELNIPRHVLHRFWNWKSSTKLENGDINESTDTQSPTSTSANTTASIMAMVYVASDLSKLLGFDRKYLPLLAALTGNDHEQDVLELVDSYIRLHPQPKPLSAQSTTTKTTPTTKPRNMLHYPSPHDRIRIVAEWLSELPLIENNDENSLRKSDALIVEKLMVKVMAAAEENIEDQPNNKDQSRDDDANVGVNKVERSLTFRGTTSQQLLEAIASSRAHYAPRTKFFSEPSPASSSSTIEQAMERGDLALFGLTMSQLLSNKPPQPPKIVCSVRLGAVDTASPWLAGRPIRMFVAMMTLFMHNPTALTKSKDGGLVVGVVEEYIRKGYKFLRETIELSTKNIKSLHESYANMPLDEILSTLSSSSSPQDLEKLGDLVEQTAHMLTHYPLIHKKKQQSSVNNILVKYKPLIMATRHMIHSVSKQRCQQSPKLHEAEVLAVVASSVLTIQAGEIDCNQVGTMLNELIKQMSTVALTPTQGSKTQSGEWKPANTQGFTRQQNRHSSKNQATSPRGHKNIKGGMIGSGGVGGTNGQQYTPKALVRASYWQNSLEHCWMLLDSAALIVRYSSSEAKPNKYQHDQLVQAYNGPMLHMLMTKLKAHASTRSQAVNTTSLKQYCFSLLNDEHKQKFIEEEIEAVFDESVRGLEADVEWLRGSVSTESEKTVKSAKTKTSTPTNPFDMLQVVDA